MSYDDEIRKIEAHIARLKDKEKRLKQRKNKERNNYIFAMGLYAEQMICHDPGSAKAFFKGFADKRGIKGNENLAARISAGLEEFGLVLDLDDSIADALAEEQAQVEAQAEALLLARASAEADAMALAMATGETFQ